MTQTISSRIVEYLSSKEPGFTFTSKDIAMALGITKDLGPITRFLARSGKKLNAYKIIQKGPRGQFLYQLVSNNFVSPSTRPIESFVGGKPGRSIGKKQSSNINPDHSPAELALQIAILLEQLSKQARSLEKFSSRELLNELASRLKEPFDAPL